MLKKFVNTNIVSKKSEYKKVFIFRLHINMKSKN